MILNADNINIDGSTVSGNGDLTIQPRTAATTIGLGGGVGTLNLTDTELANLSDGFASITIGKSDAGNVDLDTAVFNDSLTLIGASTSDAVTGTDISATSVDFQADVRPGQSPGILVVSGDTTLATGTEFAIEVGGTTAGNGASFHDQMSVAGSVTIESSVALSVTHFNSFTPAPDDTFIIISNDSADAVTGTFNGLAEGASFMVDGETYVISYVGGDGNDVVLTATLAADLISIDWDADANPDGNGTGTLGGANVTFTSTDGSSNGGQLLGQDWSASTALDDVIGINSVGIVDEGIGLDWPNDGVTPGTVHIDFNGATVTDPILFVTYTDIQVETFDFDDSLTLTILDQNPGGTIVAANNIVTTAGGATNSGNEGFAVQLTGDFTTIDFLTNVNLDTTINSVNFTVATEATNVVVPSLSLSKTAVDLNGAPLQPGDEIEYVVTVTNELGSSQAGIVITDAIPANTTYVAASASASQGSVSGPDPLVADIGSLAASASATLIFRVTVDDDAVGEIIQNSAQASSPDQPDPIEVGPIEPVGGGEVMPPDIALSLAKTAVNITGAPLIAGDIIEYVVTVTNELGSSQAGIVITDAIPAHTTYVAGSAAVSQGSVSGPDPLVANIGTLAASASATLTFRVTVDNDAWRNHPELSPGEQPRPARPNRGWPHRTRWRRLGTAFCRLGNQPKH